MNSGRPQRLAILGSTGSVGVNTLDVVARHRAAFRVVALTARNQVDLLFEQCRRFNVAHAVMLEPGAAERLERRVRQCGLECTVLCGIEGLERAVCLPEIDTVMAAIVGIAGLRPTLAAARASRHRRSRSCPSLRSGRRRLMATGRSRRSSCAA